MNEENKKCVEVLIKKAADAGDSGDAMRVSQAACNAMNAACLLKQTCEEKS